VRSWLGHAYQSGSVEQVLVTWLPQALSYWALAWGNASGNGTAVKQWYAPLESCATSSVPCPATKEAVFEGWYWLKQRIGDSARASALDTYVFNDSTGTQRRRFLAYLGLGPGPEFYDGWKSFVKLSDAQCGGAAGRTVAHQFEMSNNANGCDMAVIACRLNETKPLRAFFEPRAIYLSATNDDNIALLFHEALHGYRMEDDPSLQAYLGCTQGFDDTRDITFYLKQFVGAQPLQGIPSTCKYIEDHQMPANRNLCVR
jgi:hypothetical protein